MDSRLILINNVNKYIFYIANNKRFEIMPKISLYKELVRILLL